MRVPPIVTLTVNPCVDESADVDRVVPDRKLRCGAPRYEPGGGGINVARAVHRLGGEALAIYPAGGPAGDLLRTLLADEGVPQRAIPIASWTRENLNVFEISTGHQFRFVLPGPDLAPAEREALFAEVAGMRPFPRYRVASGRLPPGIPADYLARLARLARERGVRFVLDGSGESALRALQEGVFLVKPSLSEFQHLSGLADGGEARHVSEAPRGIARKRGEVVGVSHGAPGGRCVSDAQRWIARKRCEVVVVGLGAAGVLCVSSDSVERALAPVVPVRSTVGAGDSMLAGIVLGLERGYPLSDALRFGIAAGAATVMNPGTALCRREDAERLFEEMSTRVGSPEVTA